MRPGGGGGTLRALLVEDNATDRALYRRALEARGHDVAEEVDGESAWDRLQGEEFPLIVTDLGLAGEMDGLDLCRRIRSAPGGDRPVILVVTGRTEASTLREVMAAGADDYLRKPVDPALLGIRLEVAELGVKRQRERRAALEEARRSGQQLEVLLTNLGDVFFSAAFDPEELLQVSRSASRILGRPAEALLSGAAAWRELLFPDEVRARLLEATPADPEPRTPPSGIPDPIVHLYAILLPDGEERWVQGTYRPTRDARGRLKRVDGMIADVSERRRAEAELAARNREMEALARMAHEALASTRFHESMAAALEEVCRATRFPVAALERVDARSGGLSLELVRTPEGHSTGPWASPLGPAASAEALRNGTPVTVSDPRDFRHVLPEPLAARDPQVLVALPITGSQGPLGVLTLMHPEPMRADPRLLHLGVTLAESLAIHMERLQAYERLAIRELKARTLAQELQQANRELEAFAHTVAHDLRSPLRTMQGFSHALLQDYGQHLDPRARDFVDRIVASGERAEELITDLLAYSRMSLEELPLGPVALESVVEEALEQIQGQLREEGARITVHRPLPRVTGHARTLVQVAANLISNAAKFVADGVTPTVDIRAIEGEGGVRLLVEDNGVGIPEEKQERIFRVFERLSGDVHRPGTGIGLAIVRRGMERLGGRAGVDSAPGRGSTFWIEFQEG